MPAPDVERAIVNLRTARRRLEDAEAAVDAIDLDRLAEAAHAIAHGRALIAAALEALGYNAPHRPGECP